MNRPKASRFQELDVFRGFAALAVVCFHYTTRYDQLYGHSQPIAISFPLGHYGVQLFFMISGFVIFMTLDNCRRPLDFVISRFSRLYPAYWVAIFMTFSTVNLLGLPGREVSEWNQVFVNLSMLQRYFHVPHVDGVYWTLNVEMNFYVFMFCLWKAGWLKRYFVVLMLWLGVYGIFLAANFLFDIQLAKGFSRFFILPQIPYFCLGIASYRLAQKKEDSLYVTLLSVTALVMIGLGDGIVALLITMGFFGAFLLSLHGYLHWLVVRPLLFFGSISYTLYLVHSNIGFAIIRRLQMADVTPWLSILGAFCVAICGATLLTYLVEKPAMLSIRARYRAHVRKTAPH
jgi:peptidoglycan/LPS O-acetylase OafA/YrhL